WRVGPNEPVRKAVGRRMKLTTADEPSAERITDAVAVPSAAKTAAPITTAATNEPASDGNGVPYSARPSRNSAAAWSAKTISVETRSEPTYVAGGRGVERRRLRIPLSRRITSWIASPAKAVFAHP